MFSFEILENLMASVNGTSATISWSIAYIYEQLQFVVNYGTDDDSLDQASETVFSSNGVILTRQNYEVTLTGLLSGATYYYQVVTTVQNTTLESSISSFTTPQRGIVLAVLILCMDHFIFHCTTYSTFWSANKFYCGFK